MKLLPVLIAALFLLTGCMEKQKYEKMEVGLNFYKFPSKYVLKGENISPEIKIIGIDSKVKSIAIIMVDPDAKNFVHWLIWNIPVNGTNLTIPEGIPKTGVVKFPIKAIQGKNSFNKIGYDGPSPPPGKLHHYHFKVYGLDTFLDLEYGSNKKQLENAMHGHIIQYGEAVAVYKG